MNYHLRTLIMSSLFLLVLTVSLSANSTITLNDRSVITRLGTDDDGLFQISALELAVPQEVGVADFVLLTSNSPETVALVVEAEAVDFITGFAVNPNVLVYGESCSVHLDYDTTASAGVQSLKIVIKVFGETSYIVIEREITVEIV